MLKRLAAWLARQPARTRWLTGIAAVVLTAAILWALWALFQALFVSVPDWLAQHDVGSSKASLTTARDAARGRLLTLGAGLLAAGALVFTARNFILARRTFELTEQGQVTDRGPSSPARALNVSRRAGSVTLRPGTQKPGQLVTGLNRDIPARSATRAVATRPRSNRVVSCH